MRSLALFALALSACGAKVPPEAPPVIPVRTQKLVLQDHYEVERAYLGLVRARESTALGFEREGRVARVEVDEGAAVEAGQLIASLDVARLKAERDRLQASLRQLDVEVDLSSRTARRVGALADKQFASEQSRDEASLGLEADEARREEVKASLRQLEVELRKSAVRAPFSGTVVRRYADPGAVVGPGQPVIELQGRQVVEAELGLPITRAAELRPGESHELRWRGDTVMGRLSSVVDRVRPGGRTVTALFTLSGDRRWVQDERIELLLTERVEAEGFWIPLTALNQGPRGSWTVFVSSEGLIETEAVEILHASSEAAFVRGTVEPGQTLVLDGTHRVVPGQRVEPMEAVANGEGEAR